MRSYYEQTKRDVQREKFTTERGLCFICKQPLEPFPDGVIGMTCMSERCMLEYLPGGRNKLAELDAVILES